MQRGDVSFDILLDAAQPHLYRLNAFRATGLPVDATARDINRQARLMQIMEKYGRADSNTCGPFALDPSPGASEIQQAVQRLRDPERRLVDEFFWFWPHTLSESSKDSALAALSRNDIETARSIWVNYESVHSEANVSMHNLAVMSHLSALDTEWSLESHPLDKKAAEMLEQNWSLAFSRWRILLDDEGFWSRLTNRVRQLDDPRLTTGTVRRMRKVLPVGLLLINARLAVAAASDGDDAKARRHLELIHNSGFSVTTREQTLRKSVEPVRNHIKTLCRSAVEHANQDEERAVVIARRLIDQTAGLRGVMHLILPEENPVRDGADDEIALAVLDCAIVYANEFNKCQEPSQLTEAALQIVASESARERVESNHKICRGALRYEICHYCGENSAAEDAAHEVPMHGDVERGWDGVRWRHLTVNVPRCLECKKAHNRRNVAAGIGGVAGGLVEVGGCIDNWPDDSDLGTLVIAALVLAAFVSAGAGLGYLFGRIITPGRILPESKFDDFEDVMQLKSRGWEFGEKPSDVQQ